MIVVQPVLRIIATSCLAALIVACGSERVTYELVGSTMGTSFNVQVVSPPDTVDADELRSAISTKLMEIEQSMSTYLPDSELSLFNAHTDSGWFTVSASLCLVIENAQLISRQSGGAFDVTVGPLVNIWGFGPGPMVSEPPDPERIASVLEFIGNDRLHTDCSRPGLRKDAAEIYVDLSAYAKGYGVDQLALILQEAGIGNYLVEIGGEVRASGRNARDGEWTIAIESPTRDSRAIAAIVSLTDAAMATSGDYRNYFENAGQYYSHTIDPRTGYPVSHDGAAVTVVASTTAFADGMATALMVLGPVEGLKLVEQENIAALFQLRVDGAIEKRMSTRFAREVVAK